ncbi:MAG: helix-turn-helix transcriptional regulator [Elusimicrobia bacterium]|nr:helix-turn-helix transcriptional regulator [Elusimicrobiota bacterium]
MTRPKVVTTGEEDTWRVTDRLTSPVLLLLLHKKNSYGYELLEAMGSLGLSPDASVVYRHLRRLEVEGAVRSEWHTKGPGPARRVYKLTPEGQELLGVWIVTLKKEREVFERLLMVYEERLARHPGCDPCGTVDTCCETPHLTQIEGDDSKGG